MIGNLCIFYFVIIVLRASSYTKDVRSTILMFDREGTEQKISIAFDPVVNSLRRMTRNICIEIGCYPNNFDMFYSHVSGIMKNESEALIKEAMETHLSSIHVLDSWVAQADSIARKRYFSSKNEIRNLIFGNPVPRSTCASIDDSSSLRRDKDCFLAIAIARHNVTYHPFDKVEDWDEDLVYRWVYTASEMFNAEFYQHAEAIGFFLLSLQYRRSNYPVRVPKYVANRINVIMAEIFKELGRKHLGAQFVTQIVLSDDALSSVQPLQAFYRLRALLTVPPIPPDTEDCIRQRAAMIGDMYAFLEDIKASNTLVSLEDFYSAIFATPFHLVHQGLNDLDIQRTLGLVYQILCPELIFISPYLLSPAIGNPPLSPPSEAIRPPKRKQIKLGLISTHFFDHSIGRILVETIVHMKNMAEAQRGDTYNKDGEELFDIVLSVYYLELDTLQHENSESSREETIQRMQAKVERDQILRFMSQALGGSFIIMSLDDIVGTRDMIASKQLDFLIFTDLGMDLSTYVLAHARLATFQAAWWGHPVTSGLETMDFFFGLDIEVPNAALEKYSEQLVRMDYMSSARISKLAPTDAYTGENVPEGIELRTFRKIGLFSPDILELSEFRDFRICLVLGRLFKLHPMFDEAVIRILVEAKRTSVYVVFIAEKVEPWNEQIFNRIRVNMLRYFMRSGVGVNGTIAGISVPLEQAESRTDDLMKKVVFVSYDHYHEILQASSVVLDTFPYGGCLTAHDALSHGVPMVTLPMDHVSGRYASSMYAQMELLNVTVLQGRGVSYVLDDGDGSGSIGAPNVTRSSRVAPFPYPDVESSKYPALLMVAHNISHYVILTLALIQNDALRVAVSDRIDSVFHNVAATGNEVSLHRNEKVAAEWLRFVRRVMKHYNK